MTNTINQRWAVRNTDDTSDLEFDIRGPTTRNDVLQYLLTQVPITSGAFTLRRITAMDPVPGHNDKWIVKLSYGIYRRKQELASGDSEFYFANGSRSFTRTYSRSSVAYDANGLMSPQPSDVRVIGWNPSSRTADGVEDDETLNAFGWNIIVPFNVATATWRRNAGELRGSTNSNTFFGYPAGEVIMTDMRSVVRASELKGSGGSTLSEGEFRIEMNFLQYPNQTNLNVGGVTVAEKNGWDIIDADDQEWVEEGTPPRLVPKVSRVKVHTIKPEKDWALLSDLLGAALS